MCLNQIWQSLAAVVFVSAGSPADFWAHYYIVTLTYLLTYLLIKVSLSTNIYIHCVRKKSNPLNNLR